MSLSYKCQLDSRFDYFIISDFSGAILFEQNPILNRQADTQRITKESSLGDSWENAKNSFITHIINCEPCKSVYYEFYERNKERYRIPLYDAVLQN